MAVLALQGAFREHIRALDELGANPYPARTADDINQADAIVLPGGESTTMDKLLRKFDLRAPLARRIAGGMPVLATCAGIILLADEVLDGIAEQQPLRLLPISVRRNGYGRQPDSFEESISVVGLAEPFPAVFIRAPLIESVREGVEVLAEVRGHAVAVRSGDILGLSFHPELTGDRRIHQVFLDLVAAREQPADLAGSHGPGQHPAAKGGAAS